MGRLVNDILINAPVEKIWRILTDLELLDKTDPTVEKAALVSELRTGVGAKRKVWMKDGKNWFEEKITVFKLNEELMFQLTDCSFPIKGLTHTYSFQLMGEQTRVQQIMEYTVKYGPVGMLLDKLVIRKQFNSGIQLFLKGLKDYSEK